MYHQGPLPTSGIGGLPPQTDVANFASDLTREAMNDL